MEPGVLVMLTLRESLTEWTDTGVAIFLLAQLLGAVPGDEVYSGGYKYLGESSSPEGKVYADTLYALIDAGVLEESNTDVLVRWNPNYSLPPGRRVTE